MSIVQEMYDQKAAEYRAADEVHIQGDDYQRVRQTLGRITECYKTPIDVLDLGCGAGRYFHCMRNVNRIIGVDISRRMLEAARNPVNREEVSTSQIELHCADLMKLSLPRKSVDFIYCIGVFGNGCDLTARLVRNVRSWLRGGGRFYFD